MPLNVAIVCMESPLALYTNIHELKSLFMYCFVYFSQCVGASTRGHGEPTCG